LVSAVYLASRATKHNITDLMSYTALRIVSGSDAGTWLSAARDSDGVPRPVAALLGGRTRIEVSPEEANAAMAWAATLPGWTDADPKPLLVHPGERSD
jgi:hypothetical protein